MLDGFVKLNNMISMNFNIMYMIYIGVLFYIGLLGYENFDLGIFFLMVIMSRIIGYDVREEWCKNDGVVLVILLLYLFN